MKWRLAAWLALAGGSASASAQALTVALEPSAPVVVGVAQTYRVASVSDAVGSVSFRWNFGDGSVSDPTTATEVTHTYQAPGHYTVIVQGADDAGRTSGVFVQTAVNPATTVAPSHSSSIVFDAQRHRIWSVNPDANSVSVFDSDQLTRILEIPVGQEPHALARANDGSIWVTSQFADEIAILDADSGAVVGKVTLPYASQPRAIVFGSSGMAYVSLYATGELAELDPTKREVTRRLSLGPTPAGLAVAADGRIFVTRFISPVDHGEVWVVSPSTFTLANTIALPFDPGPDTQSSGRGVPNYVSSVVISPDGTQAWVSAKKDDTARGPQRDGQPMNADNFVRSALCAIDMAGEKERLEKRQDIDNRSMPVAVAFSPLGDYAFVLVLTSNWFGVMDAYSTQSVTGVKDVGHAPDGLVLLPDGRLFVNAPLSREVIVYDMSASLASLDHAAPEPLARMPAVSVEPMSPELLLGKQIFYDSADTRMGHAGYWSCGSCHFGGMSDGRVWDFTDRGEGLRNTKTLLGIRGANGQGRVHWSGNMDEIQDFERDIREAFEGSGFMSDTDYDARRDASGSFDPLATPTAGLSAELDALAAYITSLDHVQASPFRNADGSFTREARQGREVFARAGCLQCHSGPEFTDSGVGLLHDVGTLLPTSGMRLGAALTGIDTPTMKGLWQSAPYLHDGRAATLPDVFAFTRDHMGVVSNLTPTELGQMVRYLLELDDVPETPAIEDPGPGPTPPGSAPLSGPGCALTPASKHGHSALIALVLGILATRKRRRQR